MNSKLGWFRTFVIVVGVSIVIMLALLLGNYQSVNKQTEVGLKLVKSLYNFANLDELDHNMNEMKELVSNSVYEQLTIDNTDRSMNVYLKFKNKPVIVVPEIATDSYVIYSLQTDSISAYRKFVLFFTVGNDGKISEVRESEIIDFVDGPQLGS